MTQALNCAAAGEGAAVNNKAQGISQNRILRHSFFARTRLDHFDCGFRPRDCCGCGCGPLCRLGRRWRTHAADTRGGVFATESADGRFLYYAKLDVPGIWRMPLQGGEETRILDQLYRAFAWWDLGTGSEWNLLHQFRDQAQRDYRILRICHTQDHSHLDLTKRPFVGLSISADGSSILYAQNDFQRSDIMLVKNFR
jgi:hypothetical protein